MDHKILYFWGFIQKLLPLLLYMITTMILARFLTPSDFGTIGVLTIFITVANVLLDSGLGGSLIKEQILTKIDCSTIFIFNTTVSLILYVIIYIYAPYIESFYQIDDLCLFIRYLSLVFVINSFGLVPKSILTKKLRFKQLSLTTTVSVIIASIISIALAALGCGVYSLIFYQLSQVIISVLLYYVLSEYKISLNFDWRRLKYLFSFGFYTTIVSVIDSIYENMLITIIGKVMNIQQAGYFAQAKKIEEASVSLFSQTINNVAFPILTKNRLDRVNFQNESNTLINKSILLLFPLFFSLSVYSEIVITLLYGERWFEASHYLSILIFIGIFLFIENTYRTFIKSKLDVKALFIITLIKRLISFFIIFTTLFLCVDFIIYSFLLSSIIGCLINVIYYAISNKINLLHIMKSLINSIFPSLIYWTVLYILYISVDEEFVQIIFLFLLLYCYYIYVLPFYGIKIINFLKK